MKTSAIIPSPLGRGDRCAAMGGEAPKADHENKTEGMFPSGLQASMRQIRRCSGFGLMPNLETQRFVPKFGDDL
jgi:hypothetical protein